MGIGDDVLRSGHGDELGGHDVFGHVVGTGVITRVGHLGEQLDLSIRVPASWMKFILHKGFIALDGSSLTVGEVRAEGERRHPGEAPTCASGISPSGPASPATSETRSSYTSSATDPIGSC